MLREVSMAGATWLIAALAAVLAMAHHLVLSEEVRSLKVQLCKEEKERQAERAGRIRAQKELREKLVPVQGSSAIVSYPFTPIGILRSCFSTRNGTPRQPLLVPLSRARLTLTRGGVPAMVLDGLAHYSHCWVLYVFHENTDIGRLWTDPDNKNFRAKVKVPRLDGGRLGVLATRSPHRPCPIGLSVAKIDCVEGPNLYLSGVDIVDGSGKHSLYDTPDELLALVAQVLSWDIRSVHQRQAPHATALPGSAPGASGDGDGAVNQYPLLDLRADGVSGSGHMETAAGSTEELSENKGAGSEETDTESDSRARRTSMGENAVGEGGNVVYRLVVEGIEFAYTVDSRGRVDVHGLSLRPKE